jgi:transcriptional regulator with XRE-family HTH domain
LIGLAITSEVMDTTHLLAEVGTMSITAPHSDFPEALRHWRLVRRMSQMELALEAGVSTRHISFLETGRARPSRAMVLQLADALMMPRPAHNSLLQQAGYANSYPMTPLDSHLIAPLRDALASMMDRHSPWPAILCDKHWNVIKSNTSASALLEMMRGTKQNINLIKMFAHNPVAEQMVINLDEVRREMLGRIRLESLEAGNDPFLRELEDEVRASLSGRPSYAERPRRPLVPFLIRYQGHDLSFLTAIAHFGTSDDIAVRDLRLELLFPADDATKAFFGS